MSQSLIVSNIPVHINNAILDKYLRSKGIKAEVLAFPDEYHHINDDAKTKSLQLITETEQMKVNAAELFQDAKSLPEIEQLAKEDEHCEGQHGYALGSTGQVHDASVQKEFLGDEHGGSESKAQSARRISVTMI